MTTNQTIDGVPRELLSIYLGEIKGNRHDAGEKLRSLIKSGLPAAQPQGEPVAYLDDNGKFVFIGYEKLRTACWVDANDRAIPEAWKPLYAEQPAPVAVVLPERLDLPHRDEFESADQYAAAIGETKKWNACLDEVTRLNAKSR